MPSFWWRRSKTISNCELLLLSRKGKGGERLLREGSTDVDVDGDCCACPNEAWLLSSTRDVLLLAKHKRQSLLGCRGGLVVLREVVPCGWLTGGVCHELVF